MTTRRTSVQHMQNGHWIQRVRAAVPICVGRSELYLSAKYEKRSVQLIHECTYKTARAKYETTTIIMHRRTNKTHAVLVRVASGQRRPTKKYSKPKSSESCNVSLEFSHSMRCKHVEGASLACKDLCVRMATHQFRARCSHISQHQVHAGIFKWIYVRNKQTPSKPRTRHHVLVSYVRFFI